jgi:hypothetical protein
MRTIAVCFLVTTTSLAAPPPGTSVATLIETLQRIPAKGLLVFDVIEGSQAQRADIRVGDIITHYDGQPVSSHQELSQLARTASTDKKSEVLLILQRAGQELEKNLPVGPIGVRLEDVAPDDKRTIRPRATSKPFRDRFIANLADRREHRWYLISAREATTPSAKPRTIGWGHHYFLRDNQNAAVLRIQQEISFDERTFRQDVVIGVDPDAPPEPTGLRVMIDDKLVLFARRQADDWEGQRMGIPISSRSPRGILSSYLLPYVAASMAQQKIDQMDGTYLPPASLEAAPLCQVDRVPTNEPSSVLFRVQVLGRTESSISLDREGNVSRVELRGGTILDRCAPEDVAQTFPDYQKSFGKIEDLQLTPPAEPVRAN